MLSTASESLPISSILSGAIDGGPEPSAAMPAVSFSAAFQSQQNEDRKLAGTRFDDVWKISLKFEYLWDNSGCPL